MFWWIFVHTQKYEPHTETNTTLVSLLPQTNQFWFVSSQGLTLKSCMGKNQQITLKQDNTKHCSVNTCRCLLEIIVVNNVRVIASA